jgi:hypothetical protein
MKGRQNQKKQSRMLKRIWSSLEWKFAFASLHVQDIMWNGSWSLRPGNFLPGRLMVELFQQSYL